MAEQDLAQPAGRAAASDRLKPSMRGFGALLITLSCLSPSIGVFIVGSDVIREAGTGVFICFAAAAVLGVAMACVYAELAAAFPQAGGEPTILGRVLGPGWGLAILALNLVGLSIAQSLASLGAAAYIQAVFPDLPTLPTALVMVIAVTAIGILNIRVNAWITGLFLAAELTSLAVLAGLGFLHPHRDILEALLHPVVADAGGGLKPASLALIGAATAGGIYAFNGYGAAVFLGEELHDAHKRMAGVVFMALGVAALTELVPIIGVLIGAPDLHAMITSDNPAPAVIAALGGETAAAAMSIGVVLAIFNAMIAVALIAGRQLYSTGRDNLWFGAANRVLARIHPRFGSPWVATVVMGVFSLLGCFIPRPVLELILGNGNVLIYFGLCLAALAGRWNKSTAGAGYRMPLFPLPPIFALAFVAGVAWFDLQDASGALGLGVSLATAAAGFLYYLLVLRGRTDWRFRGADF